MVDNFVEVEVTKWTLGRCPPGRPPPHPLTNPPRGEEQGVKSGKRP